jgi:hypothetical protein
MPKIHRPLAIVAGLALAAAGLGTGVAFAATGSNAPAPPLQPAAVTNVVTQAPAAVTGPAAPAKPKAAATADSDNVQEGDQTTPDNGTEAEAPGTEGPETGNETESPSDGPGGHEDPPGNVDHQFEGTE